VDAFVTGDVAAKLRAWFASLNQGAAAKSNQPAAGDGEYVIFAPGSEVAVLHQGVLVDRVLIEPKLVVLGETVVLMYRYDTCGRGEGWVPHDQIQPTGQDWRYALWNPSTNEIRDAEEAEGGF
jgi:DEAD/DEAH box helicase domain-containing protein